MSKIAVNKFIFLIVLICVPNSASTECKNLQAVDHGDRVEVVCIDSTASTIPPYRVISLKKGTHFNHSTHSAHSCEKCHESKTGGSITGFGKDMAHALCKGCHTKAIKGPTGCKDCHSSNDTQTDSYSSSNPTSTPTTTPQGRQEADSNYKQKPFTTEETSNKKPKKIKDSFNIPPVTEYTYTYKNGIKIRTTTDTIR